MIELCFGLSVVALLLACISLGLYIKTKEITDEDIINVVGKALGKGVNANGSVGVYCNLKQIDLYDLNPELNRDVSALLDYLNLEYVEYKGFKKKKSKGKK